MKNKKGNTVLTAPFILIISMTFLLVLLVYIVNGITPFIKYQKLQMVATKYMYVIEKFGYLNHEEEQALYIDLASEGFETENIIADFPKIRQEYGALVCFEITYNMEQKYSIISDGIKSEVRNIPLHIKKYSYSKI